MARNQGEKFCLRWNEFETNISTSFRTLREDKDFFDVTLACGDHQIQAHKLILGACSSFFKCIFKQNPHQHPLLYLKGVRYEDITSVLNFMYHGEVNVAQDELNTFLEVAEDLKVKGLTQNNLSENPEDAPNIKDPYFAETSSHLPQKPRAQKQQAYRDMRGIPGKEAHIEQPLVKTEAPSANEVVEEDPNNQVVASDNYYDEAYEGYDHQYEDQQEQFGQLVGNQDQVGIVRQGWSTPKPFPCSYCNKTFANPQSLQKHTKSHTGETYCNICDKNFSTVPNLRVHTNSVHKA